MRKACEACGAEFKADGRARRTCSLACRSSIPYRFWPKVNKDGPVVRPGLGPCWIWTANTNNDGYGCFRVGSYKKAHRISYALEHGHLSDDVEVCHKCDNPPCVNPAHLFTGSHGDNVRDSVAKGRHVAPRGSESGHAKLTEAMVARIRVRIREGERQIDIAREVGLDGATINHIAVGRTWKHVA